MTRESMTRVKFVASISKMGNRRIINIPSAYFDELDKLNESYLVTYFQELIQIGIGIHIGKVVSGGIKIGRDIHTVVMGYPVNVAARLQEATKELNNNLIVSAEVYELLSDPPETEPQLIHVKGISTPLSVYLLGKPYAEAFLK